MQDVYLEEIKFLRSSNALLKQHIEWQNRILTIMEESQCQYVEENQKLKEQIGNRETLKAVETE